MTDDKQTSTEVNQDTDCKEKLNERYGVRSVYGLLMNRLRIPDYQRPYKWTHKNMITLLDDISRAVEAAEKNTDYRYRLGTVILHEEKDNDHAAVYNIVDGQQRILSLILILYYLMQKSGESEQDFKCPLLTAGIFANKITQYNLRHNYALVEDYFTGRSNTKQLLNALKKNIEVVYICVNSEGEAFQLFDSQNARGKALDPHDLLKAYHLREMQEAKQDKGEMETAVGTWEDFPADDIRDLFALHLYRIKYWSTRRRSIPFTAGRIDEYKGADRTFAYNYAQRAREAVPYFQITSPFPSGKSFFDMVGYYLTMFKEIKAAVRKDAQIGKYIRDKDNEDHRLRHVKNLFYSAMLFYCDKFCPIADFDASDKSGTHKRAMRKLFIWAFMLRVDIKKLGEDSVNKYAVGESGYTNQINVFEEIANARTHYEIANLVIKTKWRHENDKKDKKGEPLPWKDLYDELAEMSETGGKSQ